MSRPAPAEGQRGFLESGQAPSWLSARRKALQPPGAPSRAFPAGVNSPGPAPRRMPAWSPLAAQRLLDRRLEQALGTCDEESRQPPGLGCSRGIFQMKG